MALDAIGNPRSGIRTPYVDVPVQQNFLAKVRQRVDELTREGWSLPIYREQILADAARVSF